MIRRMKRTIAAIAVSAAALVLGGCSSSEATKATETTTAPATTTAEAKAAPCPQPSPIDNPDFAAAAASVPLDDGAVLVTGRYTKIGDTGTYGAAIDICDPSVTSPDDLRATATAYAKALKASPLADQIAAVWVASYQVEGGNFVNEVKLKDPDFKLHLWNGKPSESAELERWQVVG